MNENKIVLVIKNDLLIWQKLNVASFLASAIAIQFPDTHGRPFVTASSGEYLPFIKYPILIYKADSESELDRAFERAKSRQLHIGIYTQELFATRNEEENLFQISRFRDEEQPLVGLAIYGDAKKVSKAIDGLKLQD